MGGNAGNAPLPPPRLGTRGISLEGKAGVSWISGTFLIKLRLFSVFLRCDNRIGCVSGVVSLSTGMAGSGCWALFCRGDIEPVTSEFLRDFVGSSPELALPGVTGKGRPCIASDDDLEGDLELFGPFCEGVGIVELVGGALGRSHDDCPDTGL